MIGAMNTLNTAQEKVVQRIDRLEASTTNLSSEMERIQKTLAIGMPATVVNDQPAESQQGSVPLASVSGGFDEHDEKASGNASSQSMQPAIEDRVSKLEESVKFLRQSFDALREELKARTNYDLAKAQLPTDPLKLGEEHRKDSAQTDFQHIQRDRARALSRTESAKRHIPLQFRSTPKRGHLASNASTVSSGFGSTTEELPNLDDVEEASIDHMQDEDLNDDSLPPSKDPNYSNEVKSTE